MQKFDAPKAVLMANIVEGILNPKVQMPWALVLLGVFIAIVLEMCGVSSLPFAVGVYLPLSTSTPILAGGLLRWVVDRRQSRRRRTSRQRSRIGIEPRRAAFDRLHRRRNDRGRRRRVSVVQQHDHRTGWRSGNIARSPCRKPQRSTGKFTTWRLTISG